MTKQRSGPQLNVLTTRRTKIYAGFINKVIYYRKIQHIVTVLNKSARNVSELVKEQQKFFHAFKLGIPYP